MCRQRCGARKRATRCNRRVRWIGLPQDRFGDRCLEAEAEGLGAAFYWALTHALYRVMRIYNHDDALMYEERLREYADQDDEESRGQYEFPEVERALPECIRKTLKRECRDWKVRDRELLHRFSTGNYATWIGR